MVVVFAGGGTGGHLYPALAIAEALIAIRPDVVPHFVGAKRGLEARVLPERSYGYTLLEVSGLRRGRLLANLRVAFQLAKAVVRLSARFSKLRPQAVVVTGGYAAAPAGLVGALRRLPLVLQEQNEYPGITTRLLARWARQIHLAYPEAKAFLRPRQRTEIVDSGNPIRPPELRDAGVARAGFGLPETGSVVLVVGGSQGSERLNQLVLEALGEGPFGEDTSVLWATGPAHYEAVARALSDLGVEGVRAVPYIEDVHAALAAATLAVSRAGAMTTSEFLAAGLPAVLVPLPTAAEDHQARNARALEAAGVAIQFPEHGLTGARLGQEVRHLLGCPERLSAMGRAALGRARPDAARQIAAAISGLLPTTPEPSP